MRRLATLAIFAAATARSQRVGEAYGQLCWWLRQTPEFKELCPAPWKSDEALRCLEDAMSAEAARRGVATDATVEAEVAACVRDANRQNVSAAAVAAARRRCPTSPTAWLALEVRQAAADVPYWLLWHAALGAAHVVVYDNNDASLPHDAADSAALRRVLEPFVQQNFATLVSFPGEGLQTKAYDDATSRAAAGGAEFLGALDLDEFLFPFADGCLTRLLRRCRGDCGDLVMNARFSSHASLTMDPAASLWRGLGYDVGIANHLLKTFARVDATRRWLSPHHAALRHGYAHYRDDAATRVPETPQWDPALYDGQRAVVYHAHKTDFLSWVKKKSLRGRADVVVRGDVTQPSNVPVQCETCFGGLVALAAEYDRRAPGRNVPEGDFWPREPVAARDEYELRQVALAREMEVFLEGAQGGDDGSRGEVRAFVLLLLVLALAFGDSLRRRRRKCP